MIFGNSLPRQSHGEYCPWQVFSLEFLFETFSCLTSFNLFTYGDWKQITSFHLNGRFLLPVRLLAVFIMQKQKVKEQKV